MLGPWQPVGVYHLHSQFSLPDLLIFSGWCDYLVCDSIACPVDLFARVQAYQKRDLEHCCQNSDIGVPVGEEGDPEAPCPNWI
jgi:hypothetical protein